LLHVVRTHMGANDQRYGCVYQREDSKGRVGVHLSKELMAIAGHALKANITTLGPLVLPISEQLIFFGNLVARKVCFAARNVVCAKGALRFWSALLYGVVASSQVSLARPLM